MMTKEENMKPLLCNIHVDSTKIIIYRIKEKQWVGKECYSYKYEAVYCVPARRSKWIAALLRCPEVYEAKFKIKMWGSSGDMMDFSMYPHYYSTDNLNKIEKDCIDVWNYCCEGPPKIEIIDK